MLKLCYVESGVHAMVDPPRNNHPVSHNSISPETRAYSVTTLFPNCQLVIDTEACVYYASRSESSFLFFEKRLTILCSNTHIILRLLSPKDITKQHGGNQELDRF
jgi:hypothetical protein